MPKKASELNALAVARLSAPGLHFVGGVPGLALQVTITGARTWILRVMIAGRRRDLGLGGYSQSGMTLARAREQALAMRQKIRDGIDPAEESRAARSALRATQAAAQTFEQCAVAYITAHENGWRNAKHAQQWRNSLASYAYPIMGALLVRDVGLPHVLAVLEPIWRTKTETATRLRSRIELVLDWAAARGYRDGLNPARWRGHLDKLLPKPSKVARVEHHSAIPVDEVCAFMLQLRTQDGMGARALEFAILTATRSGEARGATWDEIDLTAGLWTIPGARMKAGREHRVPLSEPALDLLRALPRIVGSDLVFPAPRSNGPLSDMTLTAVMRRMGATAVPHGFRSTFRDWAAECTNYPNELCELALAHAVGNKVEAAYRRGDMYERRRMLMADWADFCTKPKPAGTVLPMTSKPRRPAAGNL